MMQEKIDERMETIVKEFPKHFISLGRATGIDPIQIEIDHSVKPSTAKKTTNTAQVHRDLTVC